MSTQELILAGDALIMYHDCPPPEAKESRKNAIKAIREWRRLAVAATTQVTEVSHD